MTTWRVEFVVVALTLADVVAQLGEGLDKVDIRAPLYIEQVDSPVPSDADATLTTG